MSTAAVTSVLGAAVAAGVWLALTWRGAEPAEAPPRHEAPLVVSVPAPQPAPAIPKLVVSKQASPFGIVPKGTVVAEEPPAAPGAGAQTVPRRSQYEYPRHSGR